MARQKKGKKQIKQTIIYVCGETEESYIKKWKGMYHTPRTNVKVVSERVISDLIVEKYNEVDVFLVLDKDDSELLYLQQVHARCKENNINLILNSECLEYWFLSHFKEVPIAYDRKDMYVSLGTFLNVKNYSDSFKGDWSKLNAKLSNTIENMMFNNYENAIKNSNYSLKKIEDGDIREKCFTNMPFLLNYLKNKKI